MVLLKTLIEEAEARYGYNKNKKTGFKRVYKQKSPSCKKGYTFAYGIKKNKKEIKMSRIDLLALKYAVEDKGLPWEVSNPILARKTVCDEGLKWEDFK